MNARGSPEFQLCAKCCVIGFAARGGADLDRGIERIDWAKLVQLARYHRIQGLVWNGLSERLDSIPANAAEALIAEAREIAMHNLQTLAECRTLLDNFNHAGVPLLFLKGVPLGALAYANPALKSAIDIDLLIDPGDLGRAASLLQERGYRSIAPKTSNRDRALRTWHAAWKESVWVKDSPSLRIDLHTRTTDNSRLIPRIDVHSPRQSVDIAEGIGLPTLAGEELFAYLAVHGASSGWFRMKWISDFAGLLSAPTSGEIEQLYHRSQQLGAGRAAGLALLLADTLFRSLERVPSLRAELSRDATIRRLHRASMRLLLSGPSEPTARLFGTLSIHRIQFGLLPGLAYKVSELGGQIRRRFSRSG